MMKSWMTAGLIATMLLGTVCNVVAEAPALRIVTEGAFAPFNFTRPDGKLDGYEIDLIHDLCKRMDIKCEISAQEWDGMIPALQAGKYDAIIAGMTKTPQREAVVAFSVPYTQSTLGFAVMPDSPLVDLAGTGETINIGTSPDKLDDLLSKWKPLLKGKSVGVQGSTIGIAFLEKYLKDTVEIREYKSTEQHDLDLLAGRVDAIFAAHPNFAATKQSPEFAEMKIIGANLRGGVFGEGVGIALRKDEPELKAAFDNAIEAAIADGTVRELSLKWFKIDTTPSKD